MKRFIIALLAVLSCAAVAFAGCYNAGSVGVQNNYSTMTESQWAEFIASLDDSEANKMQSAINGSLLSGVSIMSSFAYTKTYQSQSGGIFGGSAKTVTYHLVASGSGVIVDLDKESGDAYVITNCHVVYSDTADGLFATGVYLYLCGQDMQGVNYNLYYKTVGSGLYTYKDYYVDDDENYRIEADIIGASVTYDIALLKVSGSEILKNSAARVAAFAESDDVYYGQQVYAIGNPEGEGMAATSGIVSKDSCIIQLSLKDNPTSTSDYNDYRVIRTDAAINGGNSGGGLYNTNGELIGIINSKSVSEEIDNMGYALPGSNVKRLWKLMLDEYMEGNVYSGVTRAYLPVEYEAAYTYSYMDASGVVQTVEEVQVSKSGGGLQEGDIIKNIRITDKGGNVVENRAVTRTYHIEDTLLSARSGYTVTLSVQRGENDELTEVTVNCTFSKTK